MTKLNRSAFGVCIAACVAGCSLPPEEPRFGSIDPVERSLAIENAAQTRDLSNVDELVSELDCSDSAVRMMAIATLRDLTGQDFDYNPTDPDSKRNEAVERWKTWVDTQRASGALPPEPHNTSQARSS